MSYPHLSSRVASALFAVCSLGGALALLVACGGGSGGGSASAGTGSVAVLVTDGPVDPDEFSHIFVTLTGITLIGPGGHVPIFEGTDTIDLRAVEDTSTLVTLGRDVPAQRYEKIRLDVSEIELVPADGGASIFPKLPPKIDLNPRGSFRVHPDELLVIQIDLDAEKSIHIVEAGKSGKYNFRPVVFVDILNVPLPGKLVLLTGEVEDVGADQFLLCDTHPVSHSSGDARVTELATSDFDDGPGDDGPGDDGDDREDFCIDVHVDGDTSFFDEDGDPGVFADLMLGDPAWVLGRFLQDGDEHLDFLAEVVQQGDDVVTVDGSALSAVGVDDRFELELDPGQDIEGDGGLLQVQLQDGTKLFLRNGDEIQPGDILVGDPASAVGVLSSMEDDLLKAAWVVIGPAGTDRTSGDITAVAGGGAQLDLDTAEGPVCVDVPGDARVFEVTLGDETASAEDIDRSALQVGDSVSVFGMAGGPCFVAETVVVFEES
jgi:hypothetical protein